MVHNTMTLQVFVGLVVSFLVVVSAPFAGAVPFEKKAYLNQTDGMLYVAGMGYELPDSHVFNGTSVSNLHAEHDLAVPPCPGSTTLVSSVCNSPHSGYIGCRSARTGGVQSIRFQCAANEICAPFFSASNQRRDQCVARNFYVIRLAEAYTRRYPSTTIELHTQGHSGISSFFTDSTDSYLITPHHEQFSVNGNIVYSGTANPLIWNYGGGRGDNTVDVKWDGQEGQVANVYAASYFYS